MRDPAGQLADGFHFLRLTKLFFGQFQDLGIHLRLGDIAADGIHQIAFRWGGSPGYPAPTAVLVAIAVFQLANVIPVLQAPKPFGALGRVIRMTNGIVSLSFNLDGAVAQDGLPRRVGADDDAIQRHDGEQVLAKAPKPVAFVGPLLDHGFQRGVDFFQPTFGRPARCAFVGFRPGPLYGIR